MPSKEAVPDGSSNSTEGHHLRLEGLGLGAEELTAVRRQGFVSRETRGGSVIFKLRFRVAGRPRVKYLGCDEARAAEVQDVLDALQRVRNYDRGLRELSRQANGQLRKSKRQLEPLLKNKGWKFHGRAIRRVKRKRSVES